MFKRKKNDCPDAIIKFATTKWQKEVGLEFIKIWENLNTLKVEMRWIKWILSAVFIVIVVTRLI